MIRKINQTEETNVQSHHIAKLFSTYHTGCTPVTIIASFRNTGIVSRLNHKGISTGYWWTLDGW
jgi:hypothetical protein